jgi:hypothetical protein
MFSINCIVSMTFEKLFGLKDILTCGGLRMGISIGTGPAGGTGVSDARTSRDKSLTKPIIEHCIDALRQTLMCHADVSPNSWHVNVPMSNGIFSRIATTHTCRNFAKIQEWGRQHETSFGGAVPQNEVDRILENPPFDQTPWEDLESVWWKFPGNKFFKQWRDA